MSRWFSDNNFDSLNFNLINEKYMWKKKISLKKFKLNTLKNINYLQMDKYSQSI